MLIVDGPLACTGMGVCVAGLLASSDHGTKMAPQSLSSASRRSSRLHIWVEFVHLVDGFASGGRGVLGHQVPFACHRCWVPLDVPSSLLAIGTSSVSASPATACSLGRSMWCVLGPRIVVIKGRINRLGQLFAGDDRCCHGNDYCVIATLL